jgi:hypothetical protein
VLRHHLGETWPVPADSGVPSNPSAPVTVARGRIKERGCPTPATKSRSRRGWARTGHVLTDQGTTLAIGGYTSGITMTSGHQGRARRGGQVAASQGDWGVEKGGRRPPIRIAAVQWGQQRRDGGGGDR